jgi:MinD-like ATPase involved in chromosome partitioning or flagellar assembly
MTKFISFYSYKGGVGRTLTLVNVAAALAKEGKSVIIWDLDLEDPGVQIFPPLNRFGIQEKIKTGTVDIILDFQENDYKIQNDKLIRDSIYNFNPGKLNGIYKKLAGIKILPAGKLDDEYPGKYSRIKWNKLFDGKKNIGLKVFEWCYRVMADMNPDVVLVDSRTGLTNISLVTTVQVPDLVYLVFNYNQQNLQGLSSVYRALLSPEIQQEIRNFPLDVIPVASMVDFENVELHKRRKSVLLKDFDIEPAHEIAFHKPLIMEEDILTLTDELKTLRATEVFYEIADYISNYTPERIKKETS